MKLFSRESIAAVSVPALIACALGAPRALLAESAPTGVRGTITAVSGNMVKVHTGDGGDIDVRLAADTPIRGVALADIADIRPGSYVGTAAVPQRDGTSRALEVHVFPGSMRGAGEGSRPWDLGQNSTMTNGTVGSVVVSNGRTITVDYPDGQKRIVVPADVPIVSLDKGDRSLLVSGAHVVLFAHRNPDGVLAADFISAGRNGVVPPM
jgi:hypothetical protein